jgi:hypothetical protein
LGTQKAVGSWSSLPKLDAGEKVRFGAQKRDSGLSDVSLRLHGPLALIPVNGQKPEIAGQNSDRKLLQRTPLRSPVDDTIK